MRWLETSEYTPRPSWTQGFKSCRTLFGGPSAVLAARRRRAVYKPLKRGCKAVFRISDSASRRRSPAAARARLTAAPGAPRRSAKVVLIGHSGASAAHRQPSEDAINRAADHAGKGRREIPYSSPSERSSASILGGIRAAPL